MKLPLVEKANAGNAQSLYEKMEKDRGRVINFLKMMAHKPDVLNAFAPFYGAVWSPGELPAKTKEIAYLRTSILNGCEY